MELSPEQTNEQSVERKGIPTFNELNSTITWLYYAL